MEESLEVNRRRSRVARQSFPNPFSWPKPPSYGERGAVRGGSYPLVPSFALYGSKKSSLFAQMPCEIAAKVLSFLDLRSLFIAQTVNKFWREMLWQSFKSLSFSAYHPRPLGLSPPEVSSRVDGESYLPDFMMEDMSCRKQEPVTGNWLVNSQMIKSIASLASQLESFDISDCHALSLCAFSYLRCLLQLQHLSLARTCAGDAEMAQLAAISTLQSLNLLGCCIGDLGVSYLTSLSQLKHLYIGGPWYHSNGATRIPSTFPTWRSWQLVGKRLPQLETLHIRSIPMMAESHQAIAPLVHLKVLVIVLGVESPDLTPLVSAGRALRWEAPLDLAWMDEMKDLTHLRLDTLPQLTLDGARILASKSRLMSLLLPNCDLTSVAYPALQLLRGLRTLTCLHCALTTKQLLRAFPLLEHLECSDGFILDAEPEISCYEGSPLITESVIPDPVPTLLQSFAPSQSSDGALSVEKGGKQHMLPFSKNSLSNDLFELGPTTDPFVVPTYGPKAKSDTNKKAIITSTSFLPPVLPALPTPATQPHSDLLTRENQEKPWRVAKSVLSEFKIEEGCSASHAISEPRWPLFRLPSLTRLELDLTSTVDYLNSISTASSSLVYLSVYDDEEEEDGEEQVGRVTSWSQAAISRTLRSNVSSTLPLGDKCANLTDAPLLEHHLTMPSLNSIPLPNLASLVSYTASQRTDWVTSMLTTFLASPQLKHLSLSTGNSGFFPSIFDSALRSLTSLESLELRNFKSISSLSSISLLTKLRLLNIVGYTPDNTTKPPIFDTISHSTSIKKLGITYSASITDSDLRTIVKRMEQLEELDLTSLPRLSDRTLHRLSKPGKGLKNLVVIRLKYCPLLTPEGIASLVNLRKLYLIETTIQSRFLYAQNSDEIDLLFSKFSANFISTA